MKSTRKGIENMLKQLKKVQCLEISCTECPFRLYSPEKCCVIIEAKEEFEEKLEALCEKCGHIIEDDDSRKGTARVE